MGLCGSGSPLQESNRRTLESSGTNGKYAPRNTVFDVCLPADRPLLPRLLLSQLLPLIVPQSILKFICA
jgi:hypothetical protein